MDRCCSAVDLTLSVCQCGIFRFKGFFTYRKKEKTLWSSWRLIFCANPAISFLPELRTERCKQHSLSSAIPVTSYIPEHYFCEKSFLRKLPNFEQLPSQACRHSIIVSIHYLVIMWTEAVITFPQLRPSCAPGLKQASVKIMISPLWGQFCCTRRIRTGKL